MPRLVYFRYLPEGHKAILINPFLEIAYPEEPVAPD